MQGVNPRHFLAGGVCREEAASAFLATLLDQSKDFRERFFRLCEIPRFEVTEVIVEQQQRDVTVEGRDAFVIIENKIAAGAKAHGQLLGYYLRVKDEHPEARVHSVYLAPTRRLGDSEIAQVPAGDGEVVRAVAWPDLEALCRGLTDFDTEFAESGVACVLTAIHRRHTRTVQDLDERELALRSMIQDVATTLAPRLPHRQVVAWGCELWAYGPITVMAKCTPGEGVDGVVGSTQLRFRLAGQKTEDREYAKRWIDAIKSKGVWKAFQVDERGNWMVTSRSLGSSLAQVKESLMTIFQSLVQEIDACIAEERKRAHQSQR